jgi:hypothetical protein
VPLSLCDSAEESGGPISVTCMALLCAVQLPSTTSFTDHHMALAATGTCAGVLEAAT